MVDLLRQTANGSHKQQSSSLPYNLQVLENRDLLKSSFTIQKFSSGLKEAIQDANLFDASSLGSQGGSFSNQNKTKGKKKGGSTQPYQEQKSNVKSQSNKPESQQNSQANMYTSDITQKKASKIGQALDEKDQEMQRQIGKLRNQPTYIEQEFFEQLERERFLSKLKQEEKGGQQQSTNQTQGNSTARASKLGVIKEARNTSLDQIKIKSKGDRSKSTLKVKSGQKDRMNITQVLEFKQKKPQFFNDPKITQNIQIGGNVFQKGMRQDLVKQGFQKLLGKVLESNLTLRQIKNGQTLFEKEMMLKNYNNPYLDVDKMREDLSRYIEQTKPKSELNQQEKDLNTSLYMETGSPGKRESILNVSHGKASVLNQLSKNTTSIIEDSIQTNITQMNNFSTQMKTQTLLPPFSILKRDKALEIQKQLIFPPSPAFTNPLKSKHKLESVVDFCKTKNIPFKDEEDRFYKINQSKQSHKVYQSYLNKCFETNRPDEFDIGLQKLMKLDNEQIQLIIKQGGDPKNIKSSSLEPVGVRQPIYMPRLVKAIDNSFNEQGIGKRKQIRNNDTKATKSEIISQGQQTQMMNASSGSLENVLAKHKQNSQPKNSDITHIQNYKTQTGFNFSKLEVKQKQILQELPNKLDNPYREEIKPKKKLSKKKRNDPVRKILLTNKQIQKQKRIYNEKLMRILDRVDLDRPILMHDKLDIIWGNNGQTPTGFMANQTSKSVAPIRANSTLYNKSNLMNSSQYTSNQGDESNKIVNQFNVKAALDKRRLQRNIMNQKQVMAYNSMLEYLGNRVDRFMMSKDKTPIKVKPDEKERQFLDAFKLIVESCYTIEADDFRQILDFINIHDIKDNDNYERTRQFFKYVSKLLGFEEEIIDEVLEEMVSQFQ
ncbi:UNKNOWN [Stylonychia lemnae]|uniref:Uncharacterized protein n=1 Tax=Stylonychia lemnae TaxID=5949 RepID=A0A077ZU30_STYLE|nr:UNKNOWN [Stylonychia lemnae]|eukprot:CDW73084.1 UNKNOWN [Stylonychia lemnae]